MPKKLGSIFFSICFLAITISPSLSMMLDQKIDLIQLVDSTDEEEKSQENNNFGKEVVISNSKIENPLYLFPEDNTLLRFENFKYSKPHLNIISPPPERMGA